MREEVTERNMSQLREGSFGRLSNQLGGMPVYCRAIRNPLFAFLSTGAGAVDVAGDGSALAGGELIRD